DDTIHILANYQRFRGQGMSKNDAMHATLAHTGRILFATTSILVLSFGAFVVADFTPNLYFGVLTALTLTVALLTDMFLTSAVLTERIVAPTREELEGAATQKAS